jgi:pimeloyl-ACP methyl ester carboxylesterase
MPKRRVQSKWSPPPSSVTTVVLVHGALVRGWEMAPLGYFLRRLGYRVRQFRYRSMMKGLDENVGRLKQFITESEGEVVHVVGHSMGGVLLRQVFERDPDPRPGRLVAIGSPLLDCWVGRRVSRMNATLGPLMVGRTVSDYIARASDPVWHGTREFAVIAGTYAFGVGTVFHSHPRPSDGTILLEETQLRGITDHLVLRLNHFGLLFSRRCRGQIARFLATGAFVHEEAKVGQPVPVN